MGIWIRSQDKRRLINTQVVGLCNGDTEIWDFEFSLKLGEYSTEAKALKVLDDIQDCIIRGYDFYRMPKDED